MKAVVTGGAGFIGGHLVDLLLERDFEVTVLDNYSTGRPENLAHIEGHKRLTVHELDISNSEAELENYFDKADYVYHMASVADIVPSIQNPDEYFYSNVVGTQRVLQAARQSTSLKKFVYAASSSCYGIPDNYPTPESAEMRPQYPYALTKLMGEQLAMHWSKVYKLPVISLRLFNVYGPRSRTSGTYGAVFGVFLAQKLANRPFTVVGDGTQTRDFTYVTDVANAFYMASQSDVAGEIYNVGSGGSYSINKLVELLKGPVSFIPKRPGEPDCTFADITKIERDLGWQTLIDFESGVEKMMKEIDYWKKAPVWTPESIEKETKLWFDALSKTPSTCR